MGDVVSLAKFTDGPWRISAGNETEVFSCGALNVARANCGGMTGIRLAEAEANARLIAAAPDMYAALEWLESYAEVQVRRHPDAEDSKNWSLVLSSLAKARGEQ